MITILECEICGDPLPEHSRPNRKYCRECAYEAHRESVRDAAIRGAYRRRMEKAHPGRVRDPMKRLGMDFVELKLLPATHSPPG